MVPSPNPQVEIVRLTGSEGAGNMCLAGKTADRVLDVRLLKTPRDKRRTDHLGYYFGNLGPIVTDARWRKWREARYLELLDLAMDEVVDADEDKVINACYFCKSGNHRSVIWALVEGWIMKCLGVRAMEIPICWWSQDRVGCQRVNKPCRYCSPDAPELVPIRQLVMKEFLAFVAASS